MDMLRVRGYGEQPNPYSAWSNSYTVTSIIMQLQSFLFAERGGGISWQPYMREVKLLHEDVTQSLSICKSFQCQRCSHSHNTPWPKVKGLPQPLIKVLPTDSESGHVEVQGLACQTTQSLVFDLVCNLWIRETPF